MSDVPFGFGLPSDEGDEGPNPLGIPNFAGMDPQDFGAALHQFADLMSWQGGPVNWDLAKNLARQTVAAGGAGGTSAPAGGSDPSISHAEADTVAAAGRVAELWLDPATILPPTVSTLEAWSRAEWVEATIPVWTRLIEPVAERVVAALGNAVPGEMQQMAGPLLGVMRQMGGMMFGGQVGQAIGSLACEVVGTTDIGLPLGPDGRAALLPAGVAAYADGLGIDLDEVRLYLALREVAHQRLFAHVPWLRSRLYDAVEEYARGITIDTGRLEEAMGSLDPSNPEAVQQALAEGMFEPEDTAAQTVALARLETLLALVEGWVEQVVDAAATGRLSQAAALHETVRRRRATGGPAEQTFGTLVGLELRPRRVREASALWEELTRVRGIEGRDAVWEHPDLLPTADDLDDPSGFVHRVELDLSALDHLEGPGPARGRRAARGPRSRRGLSTSTGRRLQRLGQVRLDVLGVFQADRHAQHIGVRLRVRRHRAVGERRRVLDEGVDAAE